MEFYLKVKSWKGFFKMIILQSYHSNMLLLLFDVFRSTSLQEYQKLDFTCWKSDFTSYTWKQHLQNALNLPSNIHLRTKKQTFWASTNWYLLQDFCIVRCLLPCQPLCVLFYVGKNNSKVSDNKTGPEIPQLLCYSV